VTDRVSDANCHVERCLSLRCPCYMEATADLHGKGWQDCLSWLREIPRVDAEAILFGPPTSPSSSEPRR
jgi:hypothetical protein